jgi:hypothetical protein
VGFLDQDAAGTLDPRHTVATRADRTLRLSADRAAVTGSTQPTGVPQ